MSTLAHIAVSEPSIQQDEIDAVNDAVRSGWISSAGAYLNQFETAWAAYCGRAHGVSVGAEWPARRWTMVVKRARSPTHVLPMRRSASRFGRRTCDLRR